jgi:hypothetical protein
MNKKTPRVCNKSLRQIANPRYTFFIEKCVQAPRRRLFHFPEVPSVDSHGFRVRKPALKPLILKHLRTVEISPLPTNSFSSTSALLRKHGGVYPTPHFPISELAVAAESFIPGAVGRHAESPPKRFSRLGVSTSVDHFHLQLKSDLFHTGPRSPETLPQPFAFRKYSGCPVQNLQENHR